MDLKLDNGTNFEFRHVTINKKDISLLLSDGIRTRIRIRIYHLTLDKFFENQNYSYPKKNFNYLEKIKFIMYECFRKKIG